MRPNVRQKPKQRPIMGFLFLFKKKLKQFMFFNTHVTSMLCFFHLTNGLLIHYFKIDRIQKKRWQSSFAGQIRDNTSGKGEQQRRCLNKQKSLSLFIVVICCFCNAENAR